VTGLAFACVSFPAACDQGKESSPESPSWTPGTVYGVAIGVSSVEDVVRILGEPTSRGERFDEEADPDAEMDIWLDYETVDQERIVRVAFAADPKTHRVVEAQVTPRAMSLADAEAAYGTDYIIRTMTTGSCPATELPQKRANPSDGPLFLVYPRLGMYVYVDRETKMVGLIVYQMKC
jgi:hypothetical protein